MRLDGSLELQMQSEGKGVYGVKKKNTQFRYEKWRVHICFIKKISSHAAT